MPRLRRRASGQAFCLYGAGEEMRPVGRCSLNKGEKLVMEGKAVPVEDGHGHHIGFQLRTRDPLNGTPTPPVATMITCREMDLVAGQAFRHGRSRTAGLAEADRLTRQSITGRPLPAEDAIERAVEKLRCFAPRQLAAAS